MNDNMEPTPRSETPHRTLPDSRTKRLFHGGLHAARYVLPRRRSFYAVLCYHRIVEDRDLIDLGGNTTTVCRTAFDRQMQYLSASCRPVSLATIAERLHLGLEPDDRYVAVTFDDGYSDNRSVAWPLLGKHGIPITIFLATDYLDNPGLQPWWDRLDQFVSSCDRDIRVDGPWENGPRTYKLWDPEEKSRLRRDIGRLAIENRDYEKDVLDTVLQGLGAGGNIEESGSFLSWNDVRFLHREGVEFGAHTRSHRNLASLDDQAAREEIRVGRQRVGEEIGSDVRYFAYPYGKRISQRDSLLVAEEGFEAAFSTEFGYCRSDDDVYSLRRISVTGYDSWQSFTNRLEAPGWIIAARHLRTLSQRGNR